MCVIWLTGLSGAGKSTLGKSLSNRLQAYGFKTEILDGDIIRENLSQGLSFSKEDRDTNVKRIGFVAQLLSRNDVVVIVAAISPYRDARQKVRESIPNFSEVYVKASLESVQARDPKGLYKKVSAGEIQHFTGIDDPYEEPLAPDFVIETDQQNEKDSADDLLSFVLGVVSSLPVR